MDEILLEVSSGTLGLSHVEMLLHTLVARLLVLVKLVIEAVLGLRVLLLTLVAQRVDFVGIVLGSWNL